LQYAEKYGGDTLNRASFDEELNQLDSWLVRANTSIQETRKLTSEEINAAFNEITQITSEVAEMETLFKSLSRRFQALVSEMAMPEIEDTMKILKNQKEHLVNVRAILPVRQGDLSELVKKVGIFEEKLTRFENEAVNLQFFCNDRQKVEKYLKNMEEFKENVKEFSEKGFDVKEIEAEINQIKRQVMETHNSSNREEMLLGKFENWMEELKNLLENSSSNLLQMMVLQLNIMILSKLVLQASTMHQIKKKESREKVRHQTMETLHYIQNAERESKTNLSDADTKICTNLKILARSDLEQILQSISTEEKERILAMLDILLAFSQECSGDIASTKKFLASLREKNMFHTCS
jgi:hypothetical protein